MIQVEEADDGDPFVIENLLNGDAFDIPDLDVNMWDSLVSDQHLFENEPWTPKSANSNHSGQEEMDSQLSYRLTPPDTPPSSDRSTPPIIDVPSSHQEKWTTVVNSNIVVHPAGPVLIPQTPLSPNVQIVLPNLQSSCTQLANGYSPNAIESQIQQPVNQPLKSERRRESDEKLQLSQLRREARKIRNRESANHSRRKKQEQLETLTIKVNTLTEENQKLVEENKKLKAELRVLETENEFLKQAISPGITTNRKKATISFFVVFFMVGINFSSLLLNSDTSEKRLEMSDSRRDLQYQPRTGRSLLWSNPSDISESFRFEKASLPEDERKYPNSSYTQGVNCRGMNQTELIRLKNEFQGWAQRVGRDQVMPKKEAKRKQNGRQKRQAVDQRYLLKGMKLWKNHKMDIYNRELSDLPLSYSDLMDAIDGRDDTFYFVSLSSIFHLYLPNKANSTELRPRFSVLMPEIGNSTTNSTNIYNQQPRQQMALMQIDCEVINMNVRKVPIKKFTPGRAPQSATKNKT